MKRRVVALVVVALAACEREPRSPAEGPRPCRVSGRVVDADGAPVAEAEVRLGNPAEFVERADDEGEFAFARVRAGTWTLRVEMENRKRLRTEITVRDGQGELRVPDLVLEAGSVVEGVVVDPDGTPLVEAIVRVTGYAKRSSGRDRCSAVTGDDGSFRIGGLHNGKFRVAAYAAGHYGEEVVAAADGPAVRIVMERTVAVRARVLGDGRPLRDVAVLVDDAGEAAASTAADGTFTLGNLRPDRALRLAFSHPMFKTLAVARLDPWTGVRDFELQPGRRFHGVVVGEDGKALPGVEVFVCTKGRDDGREVETGADGTFRVGGLGEGPTEVTSGEPGFAMEPPLEVPEGVGSCRLVLRKGYEMTMLVRRKNGKPPEDVWLTVFRPDGTKVGTSFSWDFGAGRASTPELAPATYRIVVSGFVRDSSGIVAEDYGKVTIEFENPGPEKTVVLPK